MRRFVCASGRWRSLRPTFRVRAPRRGCISWSSSFRAWHLLICSDAWKLMKNTSLEHVKIEIPTNVTTLSRSRLSGGKSGAADGHSGRKRRTVAGRPSLLGGDVSAASFLRLIPAPWHQSLIHENGTAPEGTPAASAKGTRPGRSVYSGCYRSLLSTPKQHPHDHSYEPRCCAFRASAGMEGWAMRFASLRRDAQSPRR